MGLRRRQKLKFTTIPTIILEGMNSSIEMVSFLKPYFVPTTKEAFNLVLAVVVLLFISRISYIRGMQDEQFDRYHANQLLQNCLDVKKHNGVIP
jgi:hypothetical protein